MNSIYANQNSQMNFKKKDDEKRVRANYSIRSFNCRVIEPGKSPVIMQTSKAILYAESLNLDLVEIGFDKSSNCSICKVCDYSKYVYDQKKKEKEAKKQARANKVEVKSVQMTLTTDVADKERMIKHAKEFLANGDKVKISLRFRNRRELENVDMAKELMKEVLKEFDGLAVLDSAPNLAGREMSCIIRKIQK